MNDIHIILVDPHPTLCAEWREKFADLPRVEIVNGYFETLPEFDCMVSAANSFGLMDGGVDEAIIRFFGDRLMQQVQGRIMDEYLGEQPVGTCLLVEADHPKHPYIAHTPTMRVPMPIARTDNVYTAMWAMLLAIRQHNRVCGSGDRFISTIACPGLGTGVGRMAFAESARQMALAYRHFLDPPERITWQFASARQDAVRRGGDFSISPTPLPPPSQSERGGVEGTGESH